MKRGIAGCFFILLVAWRIPVNDWLRIEGKNYTLAYQAPDSIELKQLDRYFENGIETVQTFFSRPYKHRFDVFIHPNRHSLDSTWQNDWKMPSFQSECWMLASGIATRVDLVSPNDWQKEACEHIYSDTIKTQQLLTHELAHVYHGQYNMSPDFSEAEGIDWFVEGLATYASGQCDSLRLAQVTSMVVQHQVPAKLDDFWTGKFKYGLSGSMVMFIDRQYGREKLFAMLPFSTNQELLSKLNTTEQELLKGWNAFIRHSIQKPM